MVWILVHSQLMDAFQPGRAAEIRTALEQSAGISHVQDFGPDWLYQLQPARSAPVTGRFWATVDGRASLILASTGDSQAILPPGSTNTVTVRGSPWRAAALPDSPRPRLPLIVGETSVVPLALPRPANTGRYRLHLESEGFDLSPYDREVTIGAQPNPAELLAIRAEILPADVRAQQIRTGRIALPWRLLDRPERDFSISLRLLDANGEEISHADQALGGSFNIVKDWRPGMIITTTHSIAVPDAALGLYTLPAFVYGPGDPTTYLFLNDAGTPVETLDIPPVIRPEPQVSVRTGPSFIAGRIWDRHLSAR